MEVQTVQGRNFTGILAAGRYITFMPELAEVEYFRTIWNPGVGQKIVRVHVHARSRVFRGEPAGALIGGIEGASLLGSQTHGKNLLFSFSRQMWLGGHLGMTGELLCVSPDHVAGKHDHLVLYQKRHALVFRDPRMFGRLRIEQGKLPPSWWTELPPAILSSNFSVTRLRGIFGKYRAVPIKAFLLDQRYFPGIGNWMADEILWRLGIRPALPAGEMSPGMIPKLHRALRKLCTQSLATIGTTYEDPPDSWLFNHRWRDGGTCPRCRSALVRFELRGRTCCCCQVCQGIDA